MKKLFVATISLVLLMLMSCTSNKQKPEAGIEATSTEEVQEDVVYAKSDACRDTVFTFGDNKIESTFVSRYAQLSDDIYVSFNVYAIPSAPATINYIAERIDSLYVFLTGQKPAQLAPVQDTNELKANFDALTTNFIDSIAPGVAAAEDNPTRAFDIEVLFKPVYAFGDYVTYGVWMECYTGGAHGYHEAYCYTTDRTDGRPLSFDQLVKKDARNAVKQALVETIAQSEEKSVEEYLEDAAFFCNVPEGEKLTVENFPVVYVGVMPMALEFNYPPYAIAPYCDGNLTYDLPIESLRSSLTINLPASN